MASLSLDVRVAGLRSGASAPDHGCGSLGAADAHRGGPDGVGVLQDFG
jgi:hypothetical protein